MKAPLLLLLITIGFCANSLAQHPAARFNVFLRDSSNRAIFDLHPDLKHLQVEYNKGIAKTILAVYDHPKEDSPNKEKYVLGFEGDRYALIKKYPGISIPHAPKLEMATLENIKNLADSNVHVEVSTRLQRDTLCHYFSFYILKEGEYWYTFTDPYLSPKLKVNLSVFEQGLNAAFKQWKPLAVKDSALVITGMVEKDGSLHEVKLSLGEPSPFSDKILEFIINHAKPWTPAKAIRTKPTKGQAKMFLKLNPDDTISFSTL